MPESDGGDIDERVLRVAGLVLSNAFLFHEVLSRSESDVRTLREIIRSDDPVGKFLDQWDYITDEIDYAPIFDLAIEVLIRLPSTPEAEDSIEELVNVAISISRNRAALRHDLMGRLFHRLIGNPKYYGARYTKIPAANTLLNLTVEETDRDWADPDEIGSMRIADLACGTGTLLKSSLSAIVDEHVGACAKNGTQPSTQEIHADLVESGLWGFDVLPSAIHLAATGLALHDPRVRVENMRVYSLPLGGPNNRLGSVDFARDKRFLIQQTLVGEPAYSAERAIKRSNGIDEGDSVELPEFDIVTMNPPFTRNVYGSLLYGDLDENEREDLMGELRNVRDEQGLKANIRPGIGTIFVALGDRVVKSDGTLSLVLPKTVLSGTDWSKTREILDGYNLRYVVSSHESDNWNFSEETSLSETLLVAEGDTDKEGTYYVNLWEQPDSSIESLSLSGIIRDADDCELSGQGVSELKTNGTKYGEIIKAKPQTDDSTPWVLPSAFAQTELARTAYHLRNGTVYIPGQGETGEVSYTTLGSLATLGPDGRDVYDGFDTTDSTTQYDALWGMDAEDVDSLAHDSNQCLSPLSQAKVGRPLRDADTLWGRAGSLMLPKELWLSTNSVTGITLPSKALSNVWWPTRWDGPDQSTNRKMEQRLALWLNSSVGILGMLSVRQDTRGPFVKFPKAWWKSAPVLDLDSLEPADHDTLDELWNDISDSALDPFPQMDDDDTRKQIDDTFEEILDVSGLSTIREYLAREPVVSDSSLV